MGSVASYALLPHPDASPQPVGFKTSQQKDAANAKHARRTPRASELPSAPALGVSLAQDLSPGRSPGHVPCKPRRGLRSLRVPHSEGRTGRTQSHSQRRNGRRQSPDTHSAACSPATAQRAQAQDAAQETGKYFH